MFINGQIKQRNWFKKAITIIVITCILFSMSLVGGASAGTGVSATVTITQGSKGDLTNASGTIGGLKYKAKQAISPGNEIIISQYDLGGISNPTSCYQYTNTRKTYISISLSTIGGESVADPMGGPTRYTSTETNAGAKRAIEQCVGVSELIDVTVTGNPDDLAIGGTVTLLGGTEGVTEKLDLVITHGADADGTVKVNVNNTTYKVNVTAGENADSIASKIATELNGKVENYSVNASNNIVTFTSTLPGNVEDLSVTLEQDTSAPSTQKATITKVTSNLNPSNYGQQVTFTARTTANPPGGTLTGTVTFMDGTTTLDTITLEPLGISNGISTAQYSTSTLSVGSHTITAVYSGDNNFDSGTVEPLIQVVNAGTSSGGGNTGGGSSGDSGDSTSRTEEITVIVETGDVNKGADISTATIKRTTDTYGQKKDDVTYTADKAKETVENAKQLGQQTARIVIPDTKDEVSQVNVTIPVASTKELTEGKLNLEIYTENARIIVPNDSLADLKDDLYFRLIPIKKEDERKQVEERAKKEEVVREALGDGSVYVVSRPMTIETNMSSRPVELVLPLRDVTIPTDADERAKFLGDLVIFIEHTDGDRVLVKPEVVDYKNGHLGLKFGITKFSTFTILNMENWEEYLKEQEAKKEQQKQKEQQEGSHQAYVIGYPDGTFKADKSVSRAEMAALLDRVGAQTAHESPTQPFTDLSNHHWAKTVIQKVNQTGLMKGYPNGTFAPEKSITRAEMAAIVARWLQLEGKGMSKATDIEGHWAQKSIQLVDEADVMNGFADGTFQPNKSLTRAETVAILNRILKRGPLHGVEHPAWIDVQTSHWAYKDIEEASKDHSYIIDQNGIENEQN